MIEELPGSETGAATIVHAGVRATAADDGASVTVVLAPTVSGRE
ncbi:hypothetical protein [Fodinicola feengrottensis]